jgi:Cu(I)/Ag(I) efflux system membrane fusion protein
MISACGDQEDEHQGHDEGSYYTCPMHPSVKSATPGSCPVCNMSLIKVEAQKTDHEGHKGNTITLNLEQQRLAGIAFDKVHYRSILPTTAMLGTVSIDEEKVSAISSRVSGRIEKLHFTTSGQQIRKGDPIYEIYSEQLTADQKELLALLKQKEINGSSDFIDKLIVASRKKLQLWGLTTAQLKALENGKEVQETVTFYAPISGYVSNVRIKEGAYINEGTQLFELADLNTVWIEVQVYKGDKVNGIQNFKVYSEGSPNAVFNGKLVYLNPTVERNKKVQLLRLSVENKDQLLVPGMIVNVNSAQSSNRVLSVPKSAVLLEKMKTVWVRLDETTFEQRMVETGIENANYIEILSGVKEGEEIVKNGAYLVSSEFILKKGTTMRHAH